MIELRIPQSAFDPGGVFAGQDPKKTKVAIYQSAPDGSWQSFYYVTVNGLKMPDIFFDSVFYGERKDLCLMVEKGMVEVKHNGTVLSPAQIRDFHA